MQIVFQPEEPWGEKNKIKYQKKKQNKNQLQNFFSSLFFSNFIYTVIEVLNATETWRKIEEGQENLKHTTTPPALPTPPHPTPRRYGGVSSARKISTSIIGVRRSSSQCERPVSVVVATRFLQFGLDGVANRICAFGDCVRFATSVSAKHWDFLLRGGGGGGSGGGGGGGGEPAKGQGCDGGRERIQKVKGHKV